MMHVSSAADSRFVEADGLKWHVVEMGRGPLVLLIHGTAASVHSWRDVMPLMAETHQVIAVDLPGHGSTTYRTSSDLCLDRMAKGIGSLMSTLHFSPEIVAGHSAGAAILAWACAHKLLKPATFISFNGAFYPFAGMAGSLFSPIAKLIAFNPFVPRLLSGVVSRSTVEKLLKDTGSEISGEGVDLYFNLFRDPAHVRAALGMMAAWDLRDMDNHLVRIDADCVFVAGNRDKAVPPKTADQAASRCRRAAVMRFDGFGHLLHEENPQLAVEILRGRRT
jgi:magnesium chelatase accessory protein